MQTKLLWLLSFLYFNGKSVSAWPGTSSRSGGECGIPSQSASLIIRGNDFQRGAWPWMVALLTKSSSPPKLFCGAVLVSRTKVLTGERALENSSLASNGENIPVFYYF